MVSEEFRDSIIDGILKRFPDKEIRKHDVIKNNNVTVSGIAIHDRGVNVGPCIYLEKYYGDYIENGMDIQGIIEDIAACYDESRVKFSIDTDIIGDYPHACPGIRGRLVNTDMNRDILEEIPHREFLDLSLVYYMKMPIGSSHGSIRISNVILRLWNVTEEELYSRVRENMKERDVSLVQRMSDIFKELNPVFPGEETDGMAEAERNLPDMYVVSNIEKCNGAVEILNENVIEKAVNMIREDFYVIPSSIHETILVPEHLCGSPEELQEMVRTINDTQVAEEERLSYHVYKYSRESRQLQFAA